MVHTDKIKEKQAKIIVGDIVAIFREYLIHIVRQNVPIQIQTKLKYRKTNTIKQARKAKERSTT